MADTDPTGGGSTVALTIPPEDRRFLRLTFEMAREGIRDELIEHPDRLQEPVRMHRESAVYGRLIDGLDTGCITPDREVRDLLRHLADVIDQGNEYERVIAEHEALHGLLGQLTGGEDR
jgi:hypothetical protein